VRFSDRGNVIKIHEYQAKELMSRYGIRIPEGYVASDPEQTARLISRLGPPTILKAQIHAGGRGMGGGIKLANSPEEGKVIAEGLIGSHLITNQSGAQGSIVRKLLVEKTVGIKREMYFACVMDRNSQGPLLIVSPTGGMDIESVAESQPEKILRLPVDLSAGFQPYQSRMICKFLDLDATFTRDIFGLMSAVCELFIDNDCTLVEINPLVLDEKDCLIALDAKIDFDDDALFRHIGLTKLKDGSQQEDLERQATEAGVAYVKLDGTVGCLVNGAGLAMATMDLAHGMGAYPANFLDVGGSATVEKITAAVKIMLSDTKVTMILVNIFGGILRCDILAEGIVEAFRETESTLPIVVRMSGTNVEAGTRILAKSKLDVSFASTLSDLERILSSKHV
jgi:succinyl-CoA synthetase beta subunit